MDKGLSREKEVCILVPEQLCPPHRPTPFPGRRRWTVSETANHSTSHADSGPLMLAPWGQLWAGKKSFHSLPVREGNWQCACLLFANPGGQPRKGKSLPVLNLPPTLPTGLCGSPQGLAGPGAMTITESWLHTDDPSFIFFLSGCGLF